MVRSSENNLVPLGAKKSHMSSSPLKHLFSDVGKYKVKGMTKGKEWVEKS